MISRIFWVGPAGPGQIAILGRPQADRLREEISAWREAGLRMIVCLLERNEARELGLASEQAACGLADMEFVSFPIPDRGTPKSMQAIDALSAEIAARVQRGERVGVHCRSGIGRSAVIVACALMRRGHSAEAALALIAEARGTPVPDTEEQARWIDQFQVHIHAL